MGTTPETRRKQAKKCLMRNERTQRTLRTAYCNVRENVAAIMQNRYAPKNGLHQADSMLSMTVASS
jgi:hypothetical protein